MAVIKTSALRTEAEKQLRLREQLKNMPDTARSTGQRLRDAYVVKNHRTPEYPTIVSAIEKVKHEYPVVGAILYGN